MEKWFLNIEEVRVKQLSKRSVYKKCMLVDHLKNIDLRKQMEQHIDLGRIKGQ